MRVDVTGGIISLQFVVTGFKSGSLLSCFHGLCWSTENVLSVVNFCPKLDKLGVELLLNFSLPLL